MSWDFVAPLTEQKKLERVSDAKTSPDAKKKTFKTHFVLQHSRRHRPTIDSAVLLHRFSELIFAE